MHFLANNDMDFNKLFYEGVNYISLETEMRLNKLNLNKKLRAELLNAERSTHAEFQLLLTKCQPELEELVRKATKDPSCTWEMAVNIEFMRPSVYKTLEEHVKSSQPQFFFTFTYDSDHLPKRKVLTIKVHSQEEAQRIQEEESQKKLNSPAEIELGGLRKVIQVLSDLERPIIFHNGFLDAMFIYRAFVGQLPLRQEDFKAQFSYYFPSIYDTKILAKGGGFQAKSFKQNSRLEDCYSDALSFGHEGLAVEIDSSLYTYKIESVGKQQGHHEAGFDAMATGYSFLKLAKADQLLSDNSNAFVNKFHLNGLSLPFDLNEPQATSSRKSIFRCSLHAKDVKVDIDKYRSVKQSQNWNQL